eukprot:2925529-Rhodomonas_salina.1
MSETGGHSAHVRGGVDARRRRSAERTGLGARGSGACRTDNVVVAASDVDCSRDSERTEPSSLRVQRARNCMWRVLLRALAGEQALGGCRESVLVLVAREGRVSVRCECGRALPSF